MEGMSFANVSIWQRYSLHSHAEVQVEFPCQAIRVVLVVFATEFPHGAHVVSHPVCVSVSMSLQGKVAVFFDKYVTAS